LAQSTEYQNLLYILQAYIDQYLSSIGKSKEYVEKRSKDLFVWASISSHGLHHLPHTHPDSMLSGVFYSQVPPLSGSLIWDDPRGPRPPFDGRNIFNPKKGDLVIFPGWLVHQVTPTLGEEQRISWSFNLPGDWTETSDINLSL